jgi:hypothetical protein
MANRGTNKNRTKRRKAAQEERRQQSLANASKHPRRVVNGIGRIPFALGMAIAALSAGGYLGKVDE